MMEHTQKKDVLIVYLQGELDHHCASTVRGEVDRLIETLQPKTLILDVKKLIFMDSSGIGVVIGRYKIMQKRRGTVKITNATGHIDRIFQMAGLYQIIEKL